MLKLLTRTFSKFRSTPHANVKDDPRGSVLRPHDVGDPLGHREVADEESEVTQELMLTETLHPQKPLPHWLPDLDTYGWSSHAIKRGQERNVSRYEALAAIREPDFTTLNAEGETVAFRGDVSVVYEEATGNVITIRNRNSDEDTRTPLMPSAAESKTKTGRSARSAWEHWLSTQESSRYVTAAQIYDLYRDELTEYYEGNNEDQIKGNLRQAAEVMKAAGTLVKHKQRGGGYRPKVLPPLWGNAPKQGTSPEGTTRDIVNGDSMVQSVTRDEALLQLIQDDREPTPPDDEEDATESSKALPTRIPQAFPYQSPSERISQDVVGIIPTIIMSGLKHEINITDEEISIKVKLKKDE